MTKANSRGVVKKAAALTLALALGLMMVYLPESRNVKADPLDDLQAQNEALNQEIAQAKKDVDSMNSQGADLGAKLDGLKQSKSIAEDKYAQLKADLEKAANNLDIAWKRYESAVQQLQKQQADYTARIKSLFRIRNKSTLQVLLESDSLGDFYTNMRLMDYIGEVDQAQLEKLKLAQANADNAKKVAEQTKKDYETYVAQKQKEIEDLQAGIQSAESQIGDLNSKILARNSDIHNYESQQVVLDDQMRELKEQARQLAEENQRKAAAQAQQQNNEAPANNNNGSTDNGASSGGSAGSGGEAMIYPLANYHDISSYFGWRPNPFGGGGQEFHWGLDFPAPAGTPIRAALSGTVTRADAPLQGSLTGGSGFGNVVAITSPDGRMTIYGHMLRVLTSLGAYVHQGDIIGEVGSTGWSTGPHVHFQLVVPWSDADGVDPLPYLQH